MGKLGKAWRAKFDGSDGNGTGSIPIRDRSKIKRSDIFTPDGRLRPCRKKKRKADGEKAV